MNKFSYCNPSQRFKEYKRQHSDFINHCCKTYQYGVFSIDPDGTPVFYTKFIKVKDTNFKKVETTNEI